MQIRYNSQSKEILRSNLNPIDENRESNSSDELKQDPPD